MSKFQNQSTNPAISLNDLDVAPAPQAPVQGVPQAKACPHCGAILQEEWKFCPACSTDCRSVVRKVGGVLLPTSVESAAICAGTTAAPVGAGYLAGVDPTGLTLLGVTGYVAGKAISARPEDQEVAADFFATIAKFVCLPVKLVKDLVTSDEANPVPQGQPAGTPPGAPCPPRKEG